MCDLYFGGFVLVIRLVCASAPSSLVRFNADAELFQGFMVTFFQELANLVCVCVKSFI